MGGERKTGSAPLVQLFQTLGSSARWEPVRTRAGRRAQLFSPRSVGKINKTPKCTVAHLDLAVKCQRKKKRKKGRKRGKKKKHARTSVCVHARRTAPSKDSGNERQSQPWHGLGWVWETVWAPRDDEQATSSIRSPLFEALASPTWTELLWRLLRRCIDLKVE